MTKPNDELAGVTMTPPTLRELRILLLDVADVLDNYADTIDGSDSQPQANAAMSMLADVDVMIDRLTIETEAGD